MVYFKFLVLKKEKKIMKTFWGLRKSANVIYEWPLRKSFGGKGSYNRS